MASLNVSSLRRIIFFAFAATLGICLITQLHASAANTFPGTNDLVNVNTSGGGGTNTGSPYRNAHDNGISADGNLVLFTSIQTDIQGADGSGRYALYLRNMSTGVNTRVDTSASGVGGNNYIASSGGAMSETGRYVAFLSLATNLIDGTTTPAGKMYLKDMKTGAISVISNGGLDPLQVSNDGRFVLFSTQNTGTIISGVRNGYYDILLLDVANNTWIYVNAPASGSAQSVHTFANRESMSCDGDFIVFASSATNLVPSYSGSGSHVFLVDLRNGFKITDLMAGSTASSGNPVISCDGKIISFGTQNRTFVSPTPTGLNSDPHILEYNRVTGEAFYVDSDSSGAFGKGAGVPFSVSNSGDVIFVTVRTVGFATYGVLNLKHISDGSGTLEDVEKASGGSYLTFIHNNGLGALVSANSKYVVYDTRDAHDLGLTPTQTCETNPSAASDTCDVVRSKTGL